MLIKYNLHDIIYILQLQLAADIIQKLYMLAQELPSGPQ